MISDADLIADDLVPRLLDSALALRPFLTYFDTLLAGVVASLSRY